MMTGQIDHGDPLSVRIDGTDVGTVPEVDDVPEVFQGCVLKETTTPHLRLS